MSISLLQRMRSHLDAGSLLDGYQVRFYQWSDQDLSGDGQVIVFRMTGTGGLGAHIIQSPDISIQMLCSPAQVKSGDERMLQILQYLRANFETDGPFGEVFNMWPVGSVTGPTYLQNKRARFELVVRCMVNDH